MNMNALMQQAQRMQKDIQKKQEKINNTEYTGTSELVDVVVMGNKTVKKVSIKNKNIDSDDIEILEDMIAIAVNDAISKINKDVDSKIGMYGKQLGGLF